MYGTAWREKYHLPIWVGKNKPAPSYNYCWAYTHLKSARICALGNAYPECRKCNVAGSYKAFRVTLRIKTRKEQS